jgi:hypothetical protein
MAKMYAVRGFMGCYSRRIMKQTLFKGLDCNPVARDRSHWQVLVSVDFGFQNV